ncbi:ATP-dependent DNA helicase hus2/rqh1 [Fusarium oxysporum f. sp. albedinis]|nr:ATP-dependent DNA helicase hus2/rqh1 [Fusarium oxysporum f. sp. albedinis]
MHNSATIRSSNVEVSYSNPIVPGFAPDPSVVFIDSTFFLCTSLFHVFPDTGFIIIVTIGIITPSMYYYKGDYRYLDDEGILSLTPNRSGLDSPIKSPTFLGRCQHFLTSTGYIRLAADQDYTAKNIRAGISIYKDPIRYASLVYDFNNTTLMFKVNNSTTGLSGSISRKLSSGLTEVELQITATLS